MLWQQVVIPEMPSAILLVEIDGLEVEVAANKQRIAAICKHNGARSITTANEPEKRLKLWKGRKIAYTNSCFNLIPI